MPRRKVIVMPHRRRRETKTDFRQRLQLLKSGKLRLVIRKSSNNLTCQIVKHESTGDKVILTVNSTHLKKLGWKGHSNLPAAYLTGYLCGTEAKKHKVSEAIVDAGLYRSTKGSRIYAAVKGVVDSGLQVPHSKDILPGEDRLTGKHIAAYADKIKKESPEIYNKVFSRYIKNKIVPENLPTHVAEIKSKIGK